MKQYDAAIVLGTQPDFRTWKFPSYVYVALDQAKSLIENGTAQYLALCGDHALKYDHTDVKQPFREADKMEEYIVAQGLPAAKILKENVSRDTVANFYYLKKRVFEPHNLHKFLLITTDFRVVRLKFLWQKVVGPDFTVDFATVPYAQENVYKLEAQTLRRQQEWLKNVRDGDDAWFADKFYNDPYYLAVKAEDEARLRTEADPKKRYLI